MILKTPYRWIILILVGGGIGLLASVPGLSQELIFQDSFEDGDLCRWSQSTSVGTCAVATPQRIDSVLINPGIGFANFHFGWWCNLPPVSFPPTQCADRVIANWPENYPGAGTAYFRWMWSEIEPVRGQIDFNMIDTAIQSANALQENLSFRIMTISEGGSGLPNWLHQAPYNVPGETIDGTFWPDYRSSVYQGEHARLIAALGARYNGHPAIDHVDIGTVGCWGEWNTACLTGVGNVFEVFDPQTNGDYETILQAYKAVIDDHLDAFPDTPLVMLELDDNPPSGQRNWSLETMLHAVENGSGWRVDCWGDWGIFGGGWNHMEDSYPQVIINATAAYPDWPEVYQHAPIQLEICGTMPQWLSLGWTTDEPDGEVYRTFQWALEQHASVLNAKFTPIPVEYGPAIEDLLKKNGYRFTVDQIGHQAALTPGAILQISSTWSNLGVAPTYNPRTLTYRLVSTAHGETFESGEDIRLWLPGSFQVEDSFLIPVTVPPDTYTLEVALLDRAGTEPVTLPLPPLELGIQGRTSDGWYPLTQLTVIAE